MHNIILNETCDIKNLQKCFFGWNCIASSFYMIVSAEPWIIVNAVASKCSHQGDKEWRCQRLLHTAMRVPSMVGGEASLSL